MAFETKDWMKPNCFLCLVVDNLSDREEFSKEINDKYGEGGGLNANYRTVEAIAKVTNVLGLGGFEYGKSFVFKTGTLNEICFDFRDEQTKERAKQFIKNWLPTTAVFK